MMSPFLGEHLDKNDDSVWRMWKRIEEQRKQKKTTHRGWPSSESSLPRLRPADQRICLPIPWVWVAWGTCQVLSAQAELGGWEDDRVHCTDMFVRYVAARSQQLPTTVSHYTICSGKAKEYFRSKSCTCEDFKRRFLLLIEKNYVCTICGNTFNKITVLKTTSKRCIMGRSPLNVQSFSGKQNVKEHMLIHTGEAGWTCPLCDKSMSIEQCELKI